MRSAPLHVTVFDYGAGNLHSLVKSLASRDTEILVESDPIRAADRARTELLVLPGVGAFATAAARLARGRDAVRAALLAGLPCLGICLGMQLLFERSEEGEGAGIGVLPGHVRRLRAARVPQIGWNAVDAISSGEPLFGESELTMAYYANSYVIDPVDTSVVTAWSEHESDRFPAAVRGGVRGNVVGVQFHPEKSSSAGVAFVRGVVRRAREEANR